MIESFRVFVNYLGQQVYLVENSWLHINEDHPEITTEIMQETLHDPDLVLMSRINPSSELYFLKKKGICKERFTVVIVKLKLDGLWISTAMTKDKISGGAEIYRRKKC